MNWGDWEREEDCDLRECLTRILGDCIIKGVFEKGRGQGFVTVVTNNWLIKLINQLTQHEGAKRNMSDKIGRRRVVSGTESSFTNVC